MVDHAEVFRVENIGAFISFLHREILSLPLGFHHVVVPAAGLCTGTAVGIPSGEIGGQQTASRKGHAHGTVDKHFQFHFRRNLCPNTGDLLQ